MSAPATCRHCGDPEDGHTWMHAFEALEPEAPAIARTITMERRILHASVDAEHAATRDALARAIQKLKEHAPVIGSVHAWLDAAADVVRKGTP